MGRRTTTASQNDSDNNNNNNNNNNAASNKNNNVSSILNQKMKEKQKKKRKQKTAWFSLSSSSTRCTLQATVVLVATIAASLFWNQQTPPIVILDPNVDQLLQLVQKQQSEPSSSSSEVLTHAHLSTYGRTQVAGRRIGPNETILQMPREHLVWDIDALRLNPELWSARRLDAHHHEWRPLETDAFLAAHLARLIRQVKLQQQQQDENDVVDNSDTDASLSVTSPILRHYLLHVLPTWDDYVTTAQALQTPPNHKKNQDKDAPTFSFWFHPALLEDATFLRNSLKVSSATFDWVNAYRETCRVNYEAFCQASSAYCDEISFHEFAVAQVHVWTRSFGTGPPPSEHVDEQADSFLETAGVDLSRGSHSLVPVLDLYNHHGSRPNVVYRYDFDQQAFVVTSVRGIPAGHEVYDSYGKHSEAHMFAKYGFVNPDGSDLTQASLALFHPVYGEGIPQDIEDMTEETLWALQAKRLVRYLQWDDGLQDCVGPSELNDNEPETDEKSDDAFAFKILKFKHLWHVSKNASRWNIVMKPRQPGARPPWRTQDYRPTSPGNSKSPKQKAPKPLPVPTFDLTKTRINVGDVMATCRLLVMTHQDYNGTATQLLQDGLDFIAENEGETFVPPQPDGAEPLQYREIMCLLRLVEMSSQMYSTTIEAQTELVTNLNLKQQDITTKDAEHAYHLLQWYMAHLKLAEMQVLQVVKNQALQWLYQFTNQLKSALTADSATDDSPLLDVTDEEVEFFLSTTPQFNMRNKPCEWKLQHELLDAVFTANQQLHNRLTRQSGSGSEAVIDNEPIEDLNNIEILHSGDENEDEEEEQEEEREVEAADENADNPEDIEVLQSNIYKRGGADEL